MILKFLILFGFLVSFSGQVFAFGILPERESVRIKLVEDSKALVTETRYLELKKGKNKVYMDYPGVNVVPGSINIQFLENPDKISILQTFFILERPSFFAWQIYSEKEGKELARFSYLLEGLEVERNYTALVEETEDKIFLEGWLSFLNKTGEEFLNAYLISKEEKKWNTDLKIGENKKLPLFENIVLPLEKIYILDVERYGEKVILEYVFTNLTKTTLFPGKIKFYKKDEGKLVFLGEDVLKTVNRGEKIEIPVATAKDVKIKRELLEFSRINIRRDEAGNIEAYDTQEKYQIFIKNGKKKKIKVIIREYIPDTWEITASEPTDYTKEDAHHIKFEIMLDPGEEKNIFYKLRRINLLPREVVKPLAGSMFDLQH